MSVTDVKGGSPAVVGFWGACAVSGILFLEAYAARPGDAGAQAARWAPESRVHLDPLRPTLLILLHPRCPCSLASLLELGEIMARCRDRASVHAIVLHSARRDEWGSSDFERGLAGLAGVWVHQDRDGVEAQRFGVATSGHVLLYDRQGRLTFSGGITPARGHAGENYGRSAVLGRILNEPCARASHPVFGCPLATPRTASDGESIP